MTYQQVLRSLCKLQSSVSGFLDDYASKASDCICKGGGFWGTGRYGESSYRNDGASIAYIVYAVRYAMREGLTVEELTGANPLRTRT
jgi:hypothetical protein